MIDDMLRAPGTDPEASIPADDICGTAITEVVRLILELTSANAAIDYESGARVRGELLHSFGKAEQTFEALPEGCARAEALRRLDGLRIVAKRQLVIAPSPSDAAMAAAEAGDRSVWLREADEWVTERLRHGSGRPRPARRPHTDTRPDSPGALGIEPHAANHETAEPVAPAPLENRTLGEEHP